MPFAPELSLALVDLPVEVPAGSDLLRAQIAFAKGAGFRGVQLNAAAPGMRARELDRSARRDVASLLKRNDLGLSGADLWIPPEHFADASRVDRAIAATLAAVELIADLDRLMAGAEGRVLCVSLPPNTPAALISTIAHKAMNCGARVADFGPGVEGVAGVLGPGFDPAHELLARSDALTLEGGVIRLPRHLMAARLSDAGPFGRVAPGSSGGRLDLLAFAMSLVTSGYRGRLPLDLRGVADPLRAAPRAREAWEAVSQPPSS